MAITKTELTDLVYEHLKIDRKQAAELVDLYFEELKTVLNQTGELNISGFGKFTVKEKKARKGRNPATGEAMTIDERKVVSFHHSPVLKERLNK